MQRGAGAQAGSGFGGGASGTVFGSRGSSNFLSKATKWLAIAFFATYSAIAPEWRLLLITGFCGGLTTFSSFSAEVSQMLLAQRYALALGTAALHLAGSPAILVVGVD